MKEKVVRSQRVSRVDREANQISYAALSYGFDCKQSQIQRSSGSSHFTTKQVQDLGLDLNSVSLQAESEITEVLFRTYQSLPFHFPLPFDSPFPTKAPLAAFLLSSQAFLIPVPQLSLSTSLDETHFQFLSLLSSFSSSST